MDRFSSLVCLHHSLVRRLRRVGGGGGGGIMEEGGREVDGEGGEVCMECHHQYMYIN